MDGRIEERNKNPAATARAEGPFGADSFLARSAMKTTLTAEQAAEIRPLRGHAAISHAPPTHFVR